MKTNTIEIQNTYNFGKYYNPAYAHYNTKTTVACDRCKRISLDVCIGLQDVDLCMNCIEEMSEFMPQQPATKYYNGRRHGELDICYSKPRFDVIYKDGSYYNPASSHYKPETTNVTCDGCQRQSLKVCIGWQDYDMCVNCIKKMSTKEPLQNDLIQSQNMYSMTSHYLSNHVMKSLDHLLDKCER
ncbi:hypothetical protein BMW23_1106 [Bodo saltans virus]|uniref:Uncharacterized protein n=1 Tax=Bodo saltans virus TaxID=2024608 RepID=A0A2H4UWK2_9VIRU|nr:hypothetical protein QJ851_gp1086 [Bodo saltans virus]ATZ81149.1 hypothetical protein BMW23_1106 [Bodo saltans virus]